MPLEHSSSPGALKRNMHVLMGEIGKSPHVQSRKQAIAIALETQRRGSGRATGGVANFDNGGAVQQIIAALQQGAGAGVGSPGTTSTPSTTPNSSNPAAPSSTAATAMTAPPPAGVAAPGTNPAAAATSTTMQSTLPGVVQQNLNPANPIAQKLLNTGGVANRAMGGFDVAKSANLRPPPYQRQEFRNLHVGPVLSVVPGRRDNHPIKVPSSSYVLPAAHVSALGQGNTNAGMAIVSRMFGMGHRLMQGSAGNGMHYASEGGARGADKRGLVDVNVSGGEVIIPPELIIKKFGSLKKGHAILDKWIMETRKKEIKTLRKLPPPAKK